MTDLEAIAEALRAAGVDVGCVGGEEYRKHVAALAAPALRAHFARSVLAEAATQVRAAIIPDAASTERRLMNVAYGAAAIKIADLAADLEASA